MNHDLLRKTDDAIAHIEMGEATPEQVVTAIDFMNCLKQLTKDIDKRLELAAIEWLKGHGGSLTVGDTRYYVGTETHHKCRDIGAAVNAIMEACGGDMVGLYEHLSSTAIKTGMAKHTLGEQRFAELFDKIVMGDLKTGKPLKRLKQVNTKYLPQGADDAKE